MATIGIFTKTSESFTGAVKTLSINAKTTIKPADKASDKAPDYPRLRRLRGVRGRLEEDLQRGPRVPLGQAGRPELPRPHLRNTGRGRGQHAHHDLVPPQRRLTGSAAPRVIRRGAFACLSRHRSQPLKLPIPRKRVWTTCLSAACYRPARSGRLDARFGIRVRPVFEKRRWLYAKRLRCLPQRQ